MIDSPRLDLLVAKHGQVLVFVLVAVCVLALVATGWVVANPPTSTTTQQVDEEVVSTEVTSSALVVQDGLWEEGAVLEDSPVYMFRASPELTIHPKTTVPNDETSVTHEVRLRYEAERNDEVFWEDAGVLMETEATVEDRVATSETTVDVEAVRDRQRALDDELDDVGSVTVWIEVAVEYDTGTYADEQAASTQLEASENAYWLADSPSVSQEHAETVQLEVTESPNSATVGGLALLAVLALGGAAFVSSRSVVDVDGARRAVHERRYAEWISRGSIPMWVGDHHISLDTLEDVVDVAIDTNERVVHDRERGLFAVVSEDVVYYYSARGLWEETAWPELNLNGNAGVPGVGPDQPADGGDSPVADDAAGAEQAASVSGGPGGEGGAESVEYTEASDEDAWRHR